MQNATNGTSPEKPKQDPLQDYFLYALMLLIHTSIIVFGLLFFVMKVRYLNLAKFFISSIF